MGNGFNTNTYDKKMHLAKNAINGAVTGNKNANIVYTHIYTHNGKKLKAFEKAHDIRKFEIELFWRRGTYFWAFIAASYTAYLYLLTNTIGNELLNAVLLCASSFMGFFFSYSWLLVNKGSKYWQKNWEHHIDCLEREITGDLHKTYLDTNANGCNSYPFSLKPYDYSVSKITMLGSAVMTIAGIIIFVTQMAVSLCTFHECLISIIKNITVVISLEVIFIFCAAIALLLFCHNVLQWIKGNDDASDTSDKTVLFKNHSDSLLVNVE